MICKWPAVIYEVVLDKVALFHASLCCSSLCVSLFSLNIRNQQVFLPMLQDEAASALFPGETRVLNEAPRASVTVCSGVVGKRLTL